MFKYVGICFKKSCDFSGRASLCEYWYFALFNLIINLICLIIATIIVLSTANVGSELIESIEDTFNILSAIWSLIVLLPSISVTVRRLHDTNRSAWYLLFYLLLGLGCIILIFMLASDGKPGTNQWGKNPKEVE